jgi:hypothetical protein
MGKDTVAIITPTAPRAVKRSRLAARKYGDLNGLCIGLLDNNKPNADRFLEFAGELLRERYPNLRLIPKRKMTRTGADGLSEFAEDCDAVINAFGD